MFSWKVIVFHLYIFWSNPAVVRSFWATCPAIAATFFVIVDHFYRFIFLMNQSSFVMFSIIFLIIVIFFVFNSCNRGCPFVLAQIYLFPFWINIILFHHFYCYIDPFTEILSFFIHIYSSFSCNTYRAIIYHTKR